jgi:hypothetical protein
MIRRTRRSYPILGVPLFVVAGLLGGCALSEPFLIPPGAAARAAGPVDISACYNGLLTSPAELRAKVGEHCEKPELLTNASDLAICPLAQPTRAVYRCQSISAQLEAERAPMRITPAY